MKKLIKFIIKDLTPNFFKKKIHNKIDSFLNKDKYVFIKKVSFLMPNAFKKTVIRNLKALKDTSNTVTLANYSADSYSPKGINNFRILDFVNKNFQNDNNISIIFSPHGIGDAINIISVIYELNKSYPKHKWVLICKQNISELVKKLDLNFLSSYGLNKKEIDSLLADQDTYKLPASINTFAFIQFPKLDKIYINQSEMDVNENTLTNLNILGKISQSEGYLLLAPQLNVYELMNREENFIIDRIRKIFSNIKYNKKHILDNSSNEIVLESFKKNSDSIKSSKLIYLITKANSIESPNFEYIKDIVSNLQLLNPNYKIITNDINLSNSYDFIIYDPLDLYDSLCFIYNNVDFVISPVCGFFNLIISLGIIKNYISLYPTNGRNLYQFGNHLLKPKNYFIQKTFDNRDYQNELLIPYNTDFYDESFKKELSIKLRNLLNNQINYKFMDKLYMHNFDENKISNLGENLEISTSAGELMDKYVILKIKKRKIDSIEKINQINKEFKLIEEKVKFILDQRPNDKLILENLINKLEEVNELAWLKNDQIYFGFEGYFGSEEFNPSIDDLVKNSDLLKELIDSAKNFRTSQALNKKRVEIKNQITNLFSIGFLEGKSYQQDIYKNT